MSWGDAFSAELEARGRGSFPSLSERRALSKIGERLPASKDDCAAVKSGIILDMGEGSREQGFRMNGCR